MEQNPSLETDSSSKIPSMLWKPDVHYRDHKSQPFVPIRNQINPAHALRTISVRSTSTL